MRAVDRERAFFGTRGEGQDDGVGITAPGQQALGDQALAQDHAVNVQGGLVGAVGALLGRAP